MKLQGCAKIEQMSTYFLWFEELCLQTASTPQRLTADTKRQMNGSVKELNKFHIYETEKITRKASDAAEYIELFGSVTRDRHARRI